MGNNEKQNNAVSYSDMEHMCHQLAFLKFINHLIVDYPNVKLSDGQLYRLYQQCNNLDDFAEIIGTGASEDLP